VWLDEMVVDAMEIRKTKNQKIEAFFFLKILISE